MNGINYDRHDSFGDKESWHKPADGETIVLSKDTFLKFFPEVEIQGEVKLECEDASEEKCNGCDRCGKRVKLICRDGKFTAAHSNDYPTHQLGEFKWEWDGHGATEHWFDDEAISLKSTDDYRSTSGLTAHSVRVVAYKRHVEVASFRYGITDARIFPKPGRIWAEFKNCPTEYRANWTGFAIGYGIKGEHEYDPNPAPIVGMLDEVIEAILTNQIGQAIVCKHNPSVQVHIIASDPSKTSFLLCKGCRMQGVRWSEFSGRNRQDTCPYFRRACKSVVERSDAFPKWFTWEGDNFLSSALRMKDGEHLAYEVAYIRRKDGFVRRAVLLCNERTREVWMYRYAGFVPRTAMEFFGKYAEGRQISGYLGTGPRERCDDPAQRFLSEAQVIAAVAKGLEQPLWQDEGAALLDFDPEGHPNEIADYAIHTGEIGGIRIAQIDRDSGKERETETSKNPMPFYMDGTGNYYLIYSDCWNAVLRRSGEELYRSEQRYNWYLLRIVKKTNEAVPGTASA
ncbi:MAG: hypothetical protein WCX69_01825 [Candidatus Paceibacterota bacterium]